MTQKLLLPTLAGWIFGLVVFSIGFLNLLFVHPVPGNFFLLLSFLYFPPVSNYLQAQFGFTLPRWVQIVLGFLIVWFTLGVSDLGDMID
jgi:hypothetical protein